VALPALVKTLETSTPYETMATIFLLMLLYTLLMAFIMLASNIRKGQLVGVVSVFAFNLFGFLLNPQLIKTLMEIPDALMYKANVAMGWISPLNHATYHMHNFGYDLLPRLWHTYVIFIVLIALCFLLSLLAIRRYNFNFAGTEG
jgi:ABC-type transport system involved in multi-copper enzyme maturation permease subunit